MPEHHTERGTRKGARYPRNLPMPVNIADKEAREAAVGHALARLSERQRQVLALWVDGWTHREIAEQLDLHRGTVHTHIARAKRQFAKRLVECRPDGAESAL